MSSVTVAISAPSYWMRRLLSFVGLVDCTITVLTTSPSLCSVPGIVIWKLSTIGSDASTHSLFDTSRP